MIKRLAWRVQPIAQIRKRKQRHKEMQQREERFAEFVRKQEIKRKGKAGKDVPEQ